MTLFDSGNPAGDENSKPGENGQQGDKTTSFLEKLVQSKGDTWKDPEVIAKGKLEADEHIANLTKQIEEMRATMGTEDYSKKLLEILEGKQSKEPGNNGAGNANQNQVNNPNGEAQKDTTSLTADAVKDLVGRTLSERETEATKSKNLLEVDNAMKTKFGDSAPKALADAAASLGMTIEQLKGVAENSAAGFFKLVGIEPQSVSQGVFNSNPSNSGSQGGAVHGNVRDWKWYQAQRKEKGNAWYFSAKTQRELMSDQSNLGPEKFGMS